MQPLPVPIQTDLGKARKSQNTSLNMSSPNALQHKNRNKNEKNKVASDKNTKKPKARHYLAIEMGFDEEPRKKLKHKKYPAVLSLDSPLDPNAFTKSTGFEHRTVNSMVDVTEPKPEPNPASKKRLKRIKPDFIDSEVDIIQTFTPKHQSKLPKSELSTIQENETQRKGKKNKALPPAPTLTEVSTKINKMTAEKESKKTISNLSKLIAIQNTGKVTLEAEEKYPVLKNKELVDKFLKVQLTNNQKGRIRQVMKDICQGTSSTLLPEVLNNKIQAILKRSENLTDTDLRKIRVLYNMLKKAAQDAQRKSSLVAEEMNNVNKTEKKEEKEKKNYLGNPNQRYVVFVGNLPPNVTREQILTHFSTLRDHIKDVRLPQLAEDKKSSIAYVELDNAPVYEMALAMNHTMMGKRRINVLYTTPNKDSKITKAQAKAKSAKLQAMAKKGLLIGSVPLTKKRSHRRAKARAAQKAAENADQDTRVKVHR